MLLVILYDTECARECCTVSGFELRDGRFGNAAYEGKLDVERMSG